MIIFILFVTIYFIITELYVKYGLDYDKQEIEAVCNYPMFYDCQEIIKIKPILQGIRGEASCNLEAFYDAIQNVSTLMQLVPEIIELDLNPLMLTEQGIIAVDARIKIEL